MTEILETISGLALLIFLISSMLSMWLNLTIKQIIEPLKDIKLVILMPAVGELGKRMKPAAAAADAEQG